LAKQIEPGNLDGLRVLIVDDNAINCRILREMLTNWRMNPTVVESGPAALEEMLRAAKADQPFPLILLDALMPGTDGFAVAEKIKEHPELASATVMMLSSAMLTSAVVRCDDLGVTGLLTKPVTQSDLLDAILLAISKAPNERRRASEEIPPLQLTSGLRILLAEDNVVNRAVATGILQKQGHTLLHAGNGREAINAMKNQNVDLIFMDIQMPEMDGLEATRSIREMERNIGGHMPIIAMTAHAMAGDRERCLAAGMDGYVSKPIKKEDLIEAIDNFTGNGYGAGRDDAAAMPVSKAVFDREEMLEQLEGDEELFQKLIALFTENTPKILDEIRKSITGHDSGVLATASHKLVGSLGAFRAGHPRDLAMRLEERARLGDFGKAQEIFTNLEREIDKIYDALGEISGVET
jgi:CheY-like chemotaxis protein